MPAKGKPSNNPNGRPSGSSNKATAEIKEMVTAFTQMNMPRAQELFDHIADTNPEKALTLLFGTLEHFVPKQARVEQRFVNKDGEDLTSKDLEIIRRHEEKMQEKLLKVVN